MNPSEYPHQYASSSDGMDYHHAAMAYALQTGMPQLPVHNAAMQRIPFMQPQHFMTASAQVPAQLAAPVQSYQPQNSQQTPMQIAPVHSTAAPVQSAAQRPKSRAPLVKNQDEIVVPLSQWVELESGDSYFKEEQNELILRKTIVAFGIVELLRNARVSTHGACAKELHAACVIDNFKVRIGGEFEDDSDVGRIEGVEMLSPKSSLRMITPSFIRSDFFGETSKVVGEYLEVEVTPAPLDTGGNRAAVRRSSYGENDGGDGNNANSGSHGHLAAHDEQILSHLVGSLLYDLFVTGHARVEAGRQKERESHVDEPLQKKKRTTHGGTNPTLSDLASKVAEARNRYIAEANYIPLLELGFSSSLHLLVENMLDCLISLDVASQDLHLLILEPLSFLFERNIIESSDVKPSLRVRKSKLYGREAESSQITDMFCSVTSSGESEALLILGYSGSGKSRLVETLCPYCDVVGGYVVSKKFDQIQQKTNDLLVVTSAFNDLCSLIKKKSSSEELHSIQQELKSVFGGNFSRLRQILPNVAVLCPETTQKSDKQGEDNEVCLSFVLQLFCRAVSSKENPVMVFLDDLQWASSAALNLVADVLSDITSCVFFIGAYRNNEVKPQHPLFKFKDQISAAGIRLKELHLDGMKSSELNSMVADMLCVLPRHCKDLSDAVLEKTNGSPLFAVEMLRSLVERQLLQFNSTQRCWTYDLNRIRSDNPSDNVLHLLTNKLMSLPENTQHALKVASSFGISIDKSLAQCLSTTANYSEIEEELHQAVSGGFMEETDTAYKFVHDKVREAAYGLISPSLLDQFHFDVGMELLECSKGSGLDDRILFPVADQIGRVPALVESSGRQFDIAHLNVRAGRKAILHSDFSKASTYLSSAKKLLPLSHWADHYDFSLSLYLLLGKSLFSSGAKVKAEKIMNEVIKHGHSLEDKLGAHFVLNSLWNSRKEPDRAIKGSLDILKQLGETIPDSLSMQDVVPIVGRIREKLAKCADSDILGRDEIDQKYLCIMQFYSQATFFASLRKTPLFPLLVCKMVEITLENGLCKYSAGAFGYLSAMISVELKSPNEGNRLGKIGGAILDRYDDPSQVPIYNLYYYAFTSFLFDGGLNSAKQLKRGMDIGMSIGDTSLALLNGLHYIQKAFFGGETLTNLLQSIDYQLKLSDLHKHPRSKAYVSLFRETVMQLINKEKSSTDVVEKFVHDKNMKTEGYEEKVLFHRAVQCFWVSHNDRCHYFASKSKSNEYNSNEFKPMAIFSIFYHGLAALQLLRRKMNTELKGIAHDSLETMKELAGLGPYFQNKVYLLQAEHFSLARKDEKALNKYKDAIEASRASKLVHEEGLCCELAGRHCQNFHDSQTALNFYREAKQCYEEWGSQMKVDLMEGFIARLST